MPNWPNHDGHATLSEPLAARQRSIAIPEIVESVADESIKVAGSISSGEIDSTGPDAFVVGRPSGTMRGRLCALHPEDLPG